MVALDSPAATYALGLDFGTEAVRALLVSTANGAIAGQTSVPYEHGVIDRMLPTGGGALPADYALQHPLDWLTAASQATQAALAQSRLDPLQVIGIGVDFTSCTMLPCLRNGTPLALLDAHAKDPLAWPKLWKHHGAKAETDRINEVANERNEKWLARYGNSIGIEWFFPKILETLRQAPSVYAAAELWIEAGDWFVWQLTTGPYPSCDVTRLARSTCQAGYKACWNAQTGYPTVDYFSAVDSGMANVVNATMPGRMVAPGAAAGGLSQSAAALLGLRTRTPVSAAIIDAHAGVPGAGVSGEGTLVMVIGTSSCHMLNSSVEALAPGIAGVVKDGILPGYFGYETGQAAVGDAFTWVANLVKLPHEELNRRAAPLGPGSGGVLALDWLNGCRTPLMDARLSGALLGLTLGTRPEQLYRAMMEATAMGVRWIRDTLATAGVPVNHYVASGGLPAKSPLLMQIYADVLGAPIHRAPGEQPVAVGAAILGAAAAMPQTPINALITRMVPATGAADHGGQSNTFTPSPAHRPAYNRLYALYRSVGQPTGPNASAMRELRNL